MAPGFLILFSCQTSAWLFLIVLFLTPSVTYTKGRRLFRAIRTRTINSSVQHGGAIELTISSHDEVEEGH